MTRLIVPSLSELRRAAERVLRRELRPIRYVELASLALDDLDWPDRGDTAVVRAVAEDLREKILDAGRKSRGGRFSYVPQVDYVGVLQEWFTSLRLLNDEEHTIFLTADVARMAAVETILREPHMLNKDGARKDVRLKRIFDGLVIEQAISRWFRERWPALWLPPDNHGNYQQWCNHDFKIKLPDGHTFNIDAAGPGLDDLYGRRGHGKPEADIHVVGKLEAITVRMFGVASRQTFARTLFARENAQPISKFAVFLNCHQMGLDWQRIADAVAPGIQTRIA